MNCEKCQDTGIIERNHGLEFSFCDCEIGKAIEVKKRAIYGIPEENWEVKFEDTDDSNNRTEPDDSIIGGNYSSEPELTKEPKAKRKARKRAK